MSNLLLWIAVENIGKLYINKKYIDYFNPFIHGIILSSFSIKELVFNNNLQKGFNTQQLSIINLSTGYFIYDLLKMGIIKKYRNNLYIAHHLAILYFYYFFKKYKLSDFFTEALFFGELTNPILQVWHISKVNNNKILFRFTNHIFTIMFLIFRCILMPKFFYKKIKLLNNYNISNFDYTTVTSLSVIFNAGNFLWSYQLLRGYLKWLRK